MDAAWKVDAVCTVVVEIVLPSTGVAATERVGVASTERVGVAVAGAGVPTLLAARVVSRRVCMAVDSRAG